MTVRLTDKNTTIICNHDDCPETVAREISLSRDPWTAPEIRLIAHHYDSWRVAMGSKINDEAAKDYCPRHVETGRGK